MTWSQSPEGMGSCIVRTRKHWILLHNHKVIQALVCLPAYSQVTAFSSGCCNNGTKVQVLRLSPLPQTHQKVLTSA